MGDMFCHIGKPISKLIILPKHMSKFYRHGDFLTQQLDVSDTIIELFRGLVLAVNKPNNQLRVTHNKHTLPPVLLGQRQLL